MRNGGGVGHVGNGSGVGRGEDKGDDEGEGEKNGGDDTGNDGGLAWDMVVGLVGRQIIDSFCNTPHMSHILLYMYHT